MGIDGGRRACLRGAVLTREGHAQLEQLARPLGITPPWRLEASPQEAGAHCRGPCLTACPQHSIRRHEPAHTLAGSAYLSFAEAGCTFCGACANVCPAAERTTSRPVLGRAVIDSSRCLAWNQVVCMSCRNRCSYQALVSDRRARPAIDDTACLGCGGCVAACPVGAITVRRVAAASCRADRRIATNHSSPKGEARYE